MKKTIFSKAIAILGAIAMLAGVAACGQSNNAGESGNGLNKVMFMLSWAPDTNHIGVYVAKNKGYFKQAGLDVDIVAVAQAGAEQAVNNGVADFGGFYATWEGVQADMYGPKLNCFTEPDYGVPGNADTIGIITSNKTISSNPTLVRKFVQATKKGYEYAYSHPDDAAAILVKEAPDANLKLDFVKKSMKTIVNGQYWGDPAKIKDGSFTFGTNDTAGAQKYFDFLAEENAYTDSHDKVIHTAPVAKDISTDEFLK